MRLVVIDQSLKNLRGHHFNYDRAIYRAARASGWDSIFYCHQACSIEILNELPSEPVFASDIYSVLTRVPLDNPESVEDDYRLHYLLFLHELREHIAPALREDDLLLFHTLQLPELVAIKAWYAGLKQRPRVAIVLRFDIFSGLLNRKFPEKSREVYETAIPELYHLAPDAVRFYTDTRSMAAQYSGCGVPFHLIPIPLEGACGGRAAAGDGVNLVFLGDAFPHKGFGLVVEAIPRVLAERPDLRFTVQVTNTPVPFESLRRYPQVTLIEERPSEEDYYRLLSGASALLLPYDPEVYRFQSSHIFIESVLRGVTTICSESGSLAPDLEACGAEELIFAPYSSESLAAKILAFASAPEETRARFVEKTKGLADFHNSKSFISVLGAAGAPRDNAAAIIPPEIKNDELYHLIQELARSQELRHVLEIGSSSGQGSTEAFVSGLRQNSHQPQLYCMEVAEARFNALKGHYADTPFVHCYHVSSVPRHLFPSEKEVTLFHRYITTNLSLYPLEQVLGWLRDDVAGIAASGVPENGIELIRREHGITHFDMVLIDGSEFTGEAEFDQVRGACWILLDDVNAFKNYASYQRLKQDPEYELYRENWSLRNGYAVFRKKQAAKPLPVHFFTIVLNGEPFIRYHIDAMEKLDFPWHWHIVEGVAELKHDTAWSLAHGGSVPAAFHRDGRSVDGTSEYLDELARRYPDRVTVYRKPKGTFWGGKLEMVNAPLPYIDEECLLWQLDVDELWTAEQLAAARRLFEENPEKTAAFYYCHFFVGPRLVITSRDTYGNHSAYEWLRTWRFRPGLRWIAHEPPRLCSIDETGRVSDIAAIDPLRHAETEAAGLVFQHFAYALESQVRFKEDYYGYRDAVAHWTRLQTREAFPAYLAEFLPWVGDRSTVDRIESCGIAPLLRLPEVKAAILPRPTDTVLATDFVRNPGEVKSLLFLRPDSIGDNVMAASMLPHLRERFPNARITVFCQQHIAEVYEASPVVDSVIGFHRLRAYENEEYRNFMIQRLQGVGADLALNSLYSREPLYDLFAIGSGARERVAFHGNLCNIPGDMRDENNRYYTAVIRDDGREKNEMERHGDFLRALGMAPPPLSPLIWTTPDDEEQAERFFQERGLAPERTIALLPCGQWGEKIYPHYGEALGRICRDERLNVIAIGTGRDAEVAAALLASIGAPGINLAGGTSLLQTAAIIRRCRLAVGADTGTAHIACAVGTPNVVLLGGGHFARFFPYSPLTSVASLPLACYQCNWSCPYTRAHCTRDLDPGVVAHAFADALAGQGLKPRVYLQSEPLWRPLPGEPAWRDCRNCLDDTIEVRMVGELHASQAA